MDRGRRHFVLRAGVGVLGAGSVSPTAAAASAFTPSPRTERLVRLFGLAYPIFQAPLGPGVGPGLAIAVCNAGALGAISVWALPPEEARSRVAAVRAAVKGAFAANYVLAQEPRSLKLVLEAGAPIIHFSWGMPTRDQVSVVREAGARMAIQVGARDSARAALDLGADYLVCQGLEAGGHVQATRPLHEALREVLDEARDVPVVAAGGLATGAAIRKALAAGASAAMLGTRFVATRECNAHTLYKEALVRAEASDTVLTVCFDGGWPHAQHRVLRNETFRRWEAAGCPAPGKRPGENDVVMTRPDGANIVRYAAALPTQTMRGERFLDAALYAGEGVGAVRDILSAAEVLERLWTQVEQATLVSWRAAGFARHTNAA